MSNRTAYLVAYGRTKEGFITTLYKNQRHTSKRRGHKAPSYTKQELKDWLFAHPNFHKLFNLWELSGYEKMLRPSVDRLDDTLGYNFANIRLVTWEENYRKQKDIEKKPVIQLTKQGKFVAYFESISEASIVSGVVLSNVARCANGKRKTAGGYKFIFANSKLDIGANKHSFGGKEQSQM